MGTKHNFEEFKFAKQVIADFPEILTKLEKFRRDIWPYRKYGAILVLLAALDEVMISIDKNHKYYDKVVVNKGEK